MNSTKTGFTGSGSSAYKDAYEVYRDILRSVEHPFKAAFQTRDYRWVLSLDSIDAPPNPEDAAYLSLEYVLASIKTLVYGSEDSERVLPPCHRLKSPGLGNEDFARLEGECQSLLLEKLRGGEVFLAPAVFYLQLREPSLTDRPFSEGELPHDYVYWIFMVHHDSVSGYSESRFRYVRNIPDFWDEHEREAAYKVVDVLKGLAPPDFFPPSGEFYTVYDLTKDESFLKRLFGREHGSFDEYFGLPMLKNLFFVLETSFLIPASYIPKILARMASRSVLGGDEFVSTSVFVLKVPVSYLSPKVLRYELSLPTPESSFSLLSLLLGEGPELRADPVFLFLSHLSYISRLYSSSSYSSGEKEFDNLLLPLPLHQKARSALLAAHVASGNPFFASAFSPTNFIDPHTRAFGKSLGNVLGGKQEPLLFFNHFYIPYSSSALRRKDLVSVFGRLLRAHSLILSSSYPSNREIYSTISLLEEEPSSDLFPSLSLRRRHDPQFVTWAVAEIERALSLAPSFGLPLSHEVSWVEALGKRYPKVRVILYLPKRSYPHLRPLAKALSSPLVSEPSSFREVLFNAFLEQSRSSFEDYLFLLETEKEGDDLYGEADLLSLLRLSSGAHGAKAYLLSVLPAISHLLLHIAHDHILAAEEAIGSGQITEWSELDKLLDAAPEFSVLPSPGRENVPTLPGELLPPLAAVSTARRLFSVAGEGFLSGAALDFFTFVEGILHDSPFLTSIPVTLLDRSTLYPFFTVEEDGQVEEPSNTISLPEMHFDLRVSFYAPSTSSSLFAPVRDSSLPYTLDRFYMDYLQKLLAMFALPKAKMSLEVSLNQY
jgi:hypothetical protein